MSINGRTAYPGMSRGTMAAWDAQGDSRTQAQQAAIRSRILKSWSQDNRDKLAKFAKGVSQLKRLRDEYNQWIELKAPSHTSTVEKAEFEALMAKAEVEFSLRAQTANSLMKDLVSDYVEKMQKAGVTTATGFNFFDLRGPAYLIYPVNTPLRNELPRWGKVNAGYGTAINWKYTYLSPGTAYAGAQEGQRVAYAAPGEANAVATYAELGVERSVSFTAEFAGEGYTDNVADEHLRGFHELALQEESIMLGGNPGTAAGLNGFALGTANTPTVTLKTALPTNPTGAITDGGTGFTGAGTNVSVRVVELTLLGDPNNSQYGYQSTPTVTSGLTPSFTRNNADGTTNTIQGGMGAVSAASNVVSAGTANPYVLAQVKPNKGANAWAWYVDLIDASSPTTANALIVAITNVPFIYLANHAQGTQTAAATGLNADHSFQSTGGIALEFAGIFAWAVNNGQWINMSDFTSNNPVTGATNTGLLTPGMVNQTNSVPAVAEIEYDLLQQWNTFQTVADEIYCSADAKRSIQQALFKNTSGVPAYRFEISRDAQGNILGGFVVSGYKSLYAMKATGSEELPLLIHPMLPPGTILYRKTKNPYPHSRIPGVSGMGVQRDYYGIEWPITTRAWTFGTYVHETYVDYIPGLLTVRTGIVGSN